MEIKVSSQAGVRDENFSRYNLLGKKVSSCGFWACLE
jgi:hypothetical protein